MSARARRLAEYLEKNLGWIVYNEEKLCEKCMRHSLCYGDYCCYCGGLLTIEKSRKDIEAEIEEALKKCL